MNARIDYLRRRRELLISQAAAQRSEVSYIALQLQSRLRLVDAGFAIVQAIRNHPMLAATGATMLLPTPRNKLLLWASRLFTVGEIFALVRTQWRATKQAKV